MVREIFKNIMSLLAKWAIKKHQMSIIVVSGWYGTEITREFVYTVLKTKYAVRRNLKNPWWDLSFPLAILGYADYQRNWIEWLGLIIKAVVRLILGGRHKHYIVLNINYSNLETIKYWSRFIKPGYLIITGYKKNYGFIDTLIANTIINKGKILYNQKNKILLKETFKNYQKTYSFGAEKNDMSLHIEQNSVSTIYSCLGDTITVRKNILPSINNEIIASSLLMGKIKKIDLTEGLYAIIKYGLPKRLITQIKANLKV